MRPEINSIPITKIPSQSSSVDVCLPLLFKAVGTLSGPGWCGNCEQVHSKIGEECTTCLGVTTSYRQYLLSEIKNKGLGIVKLSQEKENPFDKFAVAVLVRFPHSLEHIGYVPMKGKYPNYVTSEQVSKLLDSGTPVLCNGEVLGGPDEYEAYYGMRVKISNARSG